MKHVTSVGPESSVVSNGNGHNIIVLEQTTIRRLKDMPFSFPMPLCQPYISYIFTNRYTILVLFDKWDCELRMMLIKLKGPFIHYHLGTVFKVNMNPGRQRGGYNVDGISSGTLGRASRKTLVL